MGSFLMPSSSFGMLLPQFPVVSLGSPRGQFHLVLGGSSNRKRKNLLTGNRQCGPRIIAASNKGNSNDTFTDDEDGFRSRRYEKSGKKKDDLIETRRALSEAKARQEALEKERDDLLEEFASSEANQEENVASILHDKALAVSELELAKSQLHKKLQESVQEKSALESKLVHAKQDAVELAVQVEKIAEIAFQEATSQVLEDAKLRVSAAETLSAESAFQIEDQIRKSTEGTISSIIEESRDAIKEALDVAENASVQATKAIAAFTDGLNPIDAIASVQSENIKLHGAVSDLEAQLLVSKSGFDRLKLELQQAQEQASAAEHRASNAEKALLAFQELSREKALEQEEEIRSLLENIKKEAEERKKALSKAFNAELESIKAAVGAAKETTCSRENAYMKRCEALQRSLGTSESALKMWRQRAEMAHSLLLKERSEKEDNADDVYVANGGRIDLLTDDDSQKWKLLTCGPRKEIPPWMARRIWSIRHEFPPRKADISKALNSKFKSLKLPKPDEVWSISQEKVREGDILVEHVMEKEVIEKKRKTLERALQRKTVQWQRTREETKSEPGTGTGREIVFQGFNWESWRRQWYQDLAQKAADLSQTGITAVWFPPPTESVAPQGYMPSDLYNLNSKYGSVEDLKSSIEEMHAHDLLALGDVVLNHRCAHKQSPNGVWNIFGGKLAWGPEAIVCDDPNFQGVGNPSSGDIFHAAPNVDHSQDFVRRDIKEWLNWLRNEIGYDGWRLDFVRGFSGTFVKEYIEASHPAFAIGEYWDSMAYEHGNLSYNQDAHRQRIVNWINATGGTSSAFDVTTKGILHSALHGQYWRLIDPQGKPTGVMGWWPSRACTFLENHDTGSTQGHWPFPRDKLAQGYAYILTHPGTPVLFYDHLYEFGLRDVMTELIEARRRAGIHCRSSVKIYHANNEGYVARVGDTLVMKLGSFNWNPSKENQLDGSWQKFVDKGSDYQKQVRVYADDDISFGNGNIRTRTRIGNCCCSSVWSTDCFGNPTEMKRLRSSDDLDSYEKNASKEWSQDQNQNRSSRSSSSCGFYYKPSSASDSNARAKSNLISSSRYDRNQSVADEDSGRERMVRKRVDHEFESFDRRKLEFNRYRESGGSSSLRRSESFRGPHRDFPKGFRSERDRTRRDSGSSWQRFGINEHRGSSNKVQLREVRDVKSPSWSRDSLVAGRMVGEPREREELRRRRSSKSKSRDSGSEQSKSVDDGGGEVKKSEETLVESEMSSEMEEGEFDPEPQAKPQHELAAEPRAEPQLELAAEPRAEPQHELAAEPRDEPQHELATEPQAEPQHELAVEPQAEPQHELATEPQDEPQHELATEPRDEPQHKSATEPRDEPQHELATEPQDEPQQELAIESGIRSDGKECCHKETDNDGGEMNSNVEIAEDVNKERGNEIKSEGKVDNELQDCQKSLNDGTSGNGDKMDAVDCNEVKMQEEGVKVDGKCEEDSSKDAVVQKSSCREERCKGDKGIDLERQVEECEAANFIKGTTEENGEHKINIDVVEIGLSWNFNDKGKGVAVESSNVTDSVKNGVWTERESKDEDLDMEGPSTKGFELFSCSPVRRVEKEEKSGADMPKEEKLALESLDLSLSLPNVLLPIGAQHTDAVPGSPSHGRSVQSLTNTFRTNSDGFTASMSFSGSLSFYHNPSCSLTQNSMDNNEQSVHSRPIVQGSDQLSQGSWQSHNESRQKDVPMFQRILRNGNGSFSQSSAFQGITNSQAVQAQNIHSFEGSSKASSGLERQLSFHKQNDVRSTSQSVRSHQNGSFYSYDKKQATGEKHGGSLYRSSSQKEQERLLIGGADFVQTILSKMVFEPIHVMARKCHEMAAQSIACLKESIREIMLNAGKHGELRAFQEALRSRSDLKLEMLLKCHRAQLEILVALKTGLPGYLQVDNSVSSSDLAEVFLNLRCSNVTCRSSLPVDECDCKVCSKKNGFCSACMCLVCSKFDMASNTCSWVGCDVCLHWCHVDCGLRDSYIRNGHGEAEMQFHCVACDHPSELFGFVKEVFQNFAKDWTHETFSKELEYVKKIFCGSKDTRGKRLHELADQMLARLTNKSDLPEVFSQIMSFLIDSYSFKPCLLPSFHVDLTDRPDKCSLEPELQRSAQKQLFLPELESFVRIKQEEAKMYQTRADDARREAEGLKRIVIAKGEKIEEEYRSRVAKLRLAEAEATHKQKFEEFQSLERVYREYYSMKTRMEADIKDLLLKMEATGRNLGM
ncbi:hypothetical protein V6N12_059533 [Hibiscus sabdariffa]|uniref:alpha-amylase n=1 Tax=Hibiscus sabdariffa TaxID=183260 RepID=A0ABR2EVE3_9ROSI